MNFRNCGCYACYPAVIPGSPDTPASLAAAAGGDGGGGATYCPAMVFPCWVGGFSI
jgi:hypothetical protein